MTSIPSWPAAVPLAESHRAVLEGLRPAGNVYSEWHFASAWCWNTDGSATVSRLGELVVLAQPGVDGSGRALSVNGPALASHDVTSLLAEATKLDFVPMPVAGWLRAGGQPIVVPDDRNADYVYDIAEQLALSGGRFKGIRAQLNEFRRDHPGATTVELDLADAGTHRQVLEVYETWAADASTPVSGTEERALRRALRDHRIVGMRGVGVVEHGVLLGFLLLDVTPPWAVAHVLKVRTRESGLYRMVWLAGCRLAAELGASRLNGEQDGGLPGLRAAKRHMRPVAMLDKAVVVAA